MRLWKTALLVCAAVTAVKAQSIAPPLDDTRLTVHTLLREDLFAGFIDDNTTRFERGEKNLAAKKDFAEARTLSKGGDGVPPITGGVYAVFADRLPEKDRAAAWQQAYESYSILWNAQKDQLEQLPLHFKGEVLAGMAQSAQRTGRTAESAQFVDRMLALLADTPYEGTARKWKENPSFAASATLTCKNCHSAGRLNAKLAALDGK